METESRESISSLIQRLEQEPYRFNFFQAVRLLALMRVQCERVKDLSGGMGERASPSIQSIRFRSHVSFEFAPSALRRLELSEEDPAQQGRRTAVLTSSFMGLAGHDGPLPDHYTELLLRRIREKDFALRDFLDIFNHRLIELFYQAWEKPRFFIGFERRERDPVAAMVSALLGRPPSSAARSFHVSPEFPIFFSGCLLRRPIPAEAVTSVLSSYFEGTPIELRQFEGRWIELEEGSRFRLGDPLSGSQLGEFCPLGEQIWDVQGQVKLQITVPDYDAFVEFSPGGKKAEALAAIFRSLTDSEIQVITELRLARAAPWCLTGDTSCSGRLGLSVWLGFNDERFSDRPDHVVFD